LYPNRIFYDNSAHPDVNLDDTCAYGILRGERTRIECHYHRPEIDIASVSYSDDLGETWQMCDPLMGWFDAEGIPNGYGGVTAVDEPTVAETADSGETWSHFKTIEVCTGLEEVARIPPQHPITPVRARHVVGQLPDDYGTYDYPNVEFIGDKVFVMYICGSPAEGAAHILRIYPLEWFYE